MNHVRRSVLAALLLLAPLSAWFVVQAPDVSGAESKCLGLAPTIVGDQDAAPGDGTITGTDGDDVIVATEKDDTIDAGDGDDRVCGLGGDDTLVGGAGFDRLNGGPGTDACDSERTVNCENVTSTDPAPDAPAPTTSSTMAPM